MRRRIALVAVLTLCVGAWWLTPWRRDSTLSGEGRSANADRVERASSARTSARRTASRQGLSAEVTEEQEESEEQEQLEHELVVMYEEFVNAFKQHPGHCNNAAEAIEAVVASHREDLERLRTSRATWSAEQHESAQRRLESASGPQLAKIRREIEQAVMRCRTEPRFMDALKTMATIGLES